MARTAWGFRLFFLLVILLGGCRRAPEKDNATATADASPLPATVAATAETQQVLTPTPVPRLKPTRDAEDAAAATPVPLPAEATDPTRTGWTLLVYMMAEGDLAPLALEALNRMEMSGLAGEANVLVQVDRGDNPAGADPWTGARRYQITGDGDPTVVNSPVVADLGDLNMGDPDTLADFIAWGRDDYPANHYGLLFWGDGGGWSGIAFDVASDDPLSLNDLAGALDRAKRGAAPPFALVGFDAGGMNQLDVYRTLGPFARYVVATSASLPAAGWDYARLLQAVIESPQMGAADLAQEAAATAPAAQVVDLTAVPDLVEALAALATALSEDSARTVAAVADARLQAARDEPAPAVIGARRGLINLRRFADFLAEDSPTAAISYAANTLAEATQRIKGTTAGDDEGPSLYFPATASGYTQTYDDVGLPSWRAFLQGYYTAIATFDAAPAVSAIQEAGATANVQEPAFLEFEIAGTELASLTLLGARREEDGRLRVVDVAHPSPSDDVETKTWQDGVHTTHFVWDAIGAYLPSAEGGVYGLLQPLDGTGDVFAMAGRYRRADGGDAEEAALLFDADSRRLQAVWRYTAAEGGSTTRALLPGNGDSFQVYDVYFEADRNFRYEPGATVVFSDAVPLAYDVGPLPDGDYTLGLVAMTHGGASGEAFVDIAVANRDLVSGYRSYLDPYQGFQFLYPATWPEPRHNGRKVHSDDPSSQRQLTISLLPGAGDATAEELSARVLADFGAVDVLYEEEVFVEEQTGRLTAYGYEAEDGEHTGIFVTFSSSDLDMGFVVDVDGLAADEAETLEIVNRLVTSWQFRPLGVGLSPGRWSRMEAPPFNVAVPAGYRQRALDNGWQLFQDGASFVALRSDPASGEGREAIVARWLQVATRGVAAFAAGATGVELLGDQVWSRADFSYNGDDGPVAGLVMATVVDGNEIAAWAEAPADAFATRMQTDFRILIADAVAHLQGRGNLLYSASFAEDGTWGTGTTNNAVGRVSNGAYRLEVRAAEGFYWTLAGQRFGDGSYTVSVRQSAGPLDSGYGMIVRAEGENETFYLLEVSSDGYVWIGRCDQGCAQTVTLVGDGWFFSPAVQRGRDVANTLRVEANGATLVFYVNNTEVGRVVDDTVLAGDIGLFVEALGEPGPVAVFDDFQVWVR